jgi:hypothetical protein
MFSGRINATSNEQHKFYRAFNAVLLIFVAK